MKDFKPLARSKDLVIQEADAETLVFDLTSNQASCLNISSSLVWKNCNGDNDIGEIAETVGKQTGEKVSDDLVWLALDQLSRKDLLKDKLPASQLLNGIDRRTFAKRVGLASMIALPVVASLIAPPAAYANSLCVVGGACTCNSPSNGRVGQVCTPSVSCADTNCNCTFANNGNNANGNCVV